MAGGGAEGAFYVLSGVCGLSEGWKGGKSGAERGNGAEEEGGHSVFPFLVVDQVNEVVDVEEAVSIFVERFAVCGISWGGQLEVGNREIVVYMWGKEGTLRCLIEVFRHAWQRKAR